MDTRPFHYLKQAALSCAFAGYLVTAAIADEPAARLETPPADGVVSRPEPAPIEAPARDGSAAASRAGEQPRVATDSRPPQARARVARPALREPRPNTQSGIDHFYY